LAFSSSQNCQIGISGCNRISSPINMAMCNVSPERSGSYNVVGLDAGFKWNALGWRNTLSSIYLHNPTVFPLRLKPGSMVYASWRTGYLPRTFEASGSYGAFNAPLASQNQTQWAVWPRLLVFSSSCCPVRIRLNMVKKHSNNTK